MTRLCRCGRAATVVCTEGRFLDANRVLHVGITPGPGNMPGTRCDWCWYACDEAEHQATDGVGRRSGEVLALAEHDELVRDWDARWYRDRLQQSAAVILLDPDAQPLGISAGNLDASLGAGGFGYG